jgi:hypothetical protein
MQSSGMESLKGSVNKPIKLEELNVSIGKKLCPNEEKVKILEMFRKHILKRFDLDDAGGGILLD